METLQETAEISSAEAVHTAAVHADAIEIARADQLKVAVSEGLKNAVPIADLLMIRECIQEAVTIGINKDVNGGVKALRQEVSEVRHAVINHNLKHETDMIRIMPIIEAFETSERAVAAAKSGGKIVIWIAGFITALGGAYLIIKQLF